MKLLWVFYEINPSMKQIISGLKHVPNSFFRVSKSTNESNQISIRMRNVVDFQSSRNRKIESKRSRFCTFLMSPALSLSLLSFKCLRNCCSVILTALENRHYPFLMSSLTSSVTSLSPLTSSRLWRLSPRRSWPTFEADQNFENAAVKS